MHIHLWFDALSYVSSAWLFRTYFYKKDLLPSGELRWYYYTVVIVGFVVGAMGLSLLNVWISLDQWMLGKSVLGALFGAIVSIELFKYFTGIKGSTGAYFVPSLALGIAIGRVGCFMTGLDDYTYGVETTLPWGVDFGDGVLRHPVQLYESVMMFGFFLYSMWMHKHKKVYFEAKIFYIFVLFYATQRFVWEFLKPYVDVVFGLNVFQLVCLTLMVYAIIYLKRSAHGTLFKKI
ncbi:MAG TPA: diacylglyceryl transferase [Epsilonproteobacteria bacterium]|nr:diacylglyceryl transferase [Campylobacterota bacterium]